MKVLAYLPLHYGKDYLAYSIKSYYQHVDEILICYSPKPSHGHGTNLICPDTEDELVEVASSADPDNKIVWHKGNWNRENEQRNYAHDYAKVKGFDILFNADFDEIWKPELVGLLINETYIRKASKCLIWMKHLWRSFDHICEDAMRQERIYYVKPDKQDLIYSNNGTNDVWHFGYARKPDDIRYKMGIHGHKNEFNKGDWFNNVYMKFPERKNDLHPTCVETWDARPFDKNELPEFMKKHPYYKLPII